jgi:hypothetical protein
MNFSKTITSIILQVTTIIIFITIFFITYATRVERDMVAHEVDVLIGDFTSNIDVICTEKQLEELRAELSTLEPPDMKEEDAIVEKKNSELIWSTIKLVGIIGIVGIFITVVLGCYYKLSFLQLSKECLFGLITVALVEYVFLTYIVKNYNSLDPNWVKLYIVQVLQNYGNS